MSYKLNPFTGKLDLTGGDIQTSGDFELNTVPSTYSTFKYDRGSQSSAGKYTISGSGSTAKFLINKTDANGNAADTPVSGGEFWMSADGVTFVQGVLGTGSVLDFGSYWLLPSLVDHGVYEGLNIPDANGSDFYWSLGDPTGTPVALADGDVVQYNAADGKFKPAQISSGTTLPTANDGQTLIQENGQWVAGPVIGGVDYTTVITGAPTYTVPTGYTFWSETWQVFPNGSTDITLSNGDLTASVTTGGANVAASSTAKSSGKWYWEIEINSSTADTFIGIKTTTDGSFPGQSGSGGIGIRKSGSIFNDSVANTNSASVVGYADSDIVMFALDMDNGELYMGKNGSWAGISDPSTGTSPFANTLTAGSYYFIGRGAVVGEEFTINKVSSSVQTIIPSTTARAEVSGATASIADGASADVTIAKTGKAGQLLSIQTSAAAWVTVYTDQAARTADASRTETTDPTPGSGVIAEAITTGAQTVILTPGNTFFNNESTPVSELYLKVVNKSGASAAITTTLKVIPSEV